MQQKFHFCVRFCLVYIVPQSNSTRDCWWKGFKFNFRGFTFIARKLYLSICSGVNVHLSPFCKNPYDYSVFSLTLARSPMASSFYRRASWFWSYSPGLASDILVEKAGKKSLLVYWWRSRRSFWLNLQFLMCFEL